jgi:hypothetical protein
MTRYEVRSTKCVVATVAFFCLLAGARDARACTCVSFPACRSAFQSDVVFTGTATTITPLGGPRDDYDVTFTVIRGFRGIDMAVATLRVQAGNECGPGLRHGETYLVYGRRQNGSLSTSGCELQAVKWASDDLKFLQTLSSPSKGARVFGSVHWYDEAFDRHPSRGVTVTLRGSERTWSTRTDRQGRYQFERVPQGSYSVTATPPRGFETEDPQEVTLPDLHACDIADFDLDPQPR